MTRSNVVYRRVMKEHGASGVLTLLRLTEPRSAGAAARERSAKTKNKFSTSAFEQILITPELLIHHERKDFSTPPFSP